jgi:CelD/BcsL family acetyltransferase involved in cellulose biosynthesis
VTATQTVGCLNGLAVRQAAIEPKAEPKVARSIDPLTDRRWEEFVETHPHASLFHSTPWLTALARTYGYEPVVYTTSQHGRRLRNGLVFCRVESWLTGRRLVSLPFSDHCGPLLDAAKYEIRANDTQHDLDAVSVALEQELQRNGWRYIEMRPLQALPMNTSLSCSTTPYTLHRLDLRPDLATLFHNCHKSSTQRKILRAEREGLRYQEGTTEDLLDDFYRLHAITRRRHHRPPQPRQWFHNLVDCFGRALKIRVALKDGQPVAAILTISYKDTMVYKYGGSDARFNHLGGMHMLLWRTIEEAKARGFGTVDFGRSEAGQTGLITFKKRWGSEQSSLIYSRYSLSGNVQHLFEPSAGGWKSKLANCVLAHMHPGALSLAGRLLYKHVG